MSAARADAGKGGSKAARSDSADKTLVSDILPLATPRFRGRIGNTYVDSEADLIELPTAPAGAPNVLLVVLADVATAGRSRSALQPLSHHRAVFADPGGAALGSQSPLRPHGRHHGNGDRVSRLRRFLAEGGRQHRRNPARQSLQHGGLWKVAQHTGPRAERGGPVRSLADRQGLRLLVRIPGRRGEPVAHAAFREHRADRTAARQSELAFF